MPKNLLDVLKGTLGCGAGIKGDWDCTPTVGADFAIVDSFRATYNAETKVATADWSGISTVAPGTPYVGMLKTDLTLGSISLNEVKKLSLQITADLADPTVFVYVGAFFLDSNAYSAETAATMLFNLVANTTPLPKPYMYLIGTTNAVTGDGIGVLSEITAVTDGYPSGSTAATYAAFASTVDLSAAGAGDNITMFLSRTGASLPENGEAINIAPALFDSTGTMLSVGQMQELPGNPVLNSGMTLYIGLLTATQSGTVLPPASIGVDITAGPNTATLSGITFTSGSLGFTQGDWDMVYATPATGFVPVIQAIFPLGAKKNDQFRVKIQPPATQGTPYGTVVTPEAVVVVDNVNPGQEAFRVMVDSANMEARLAQLDFSTQIGALTALVDEAGRRAGEMVFYVRSTDPGVEPLVGPGVYDSFELAYEAAILQPKHIRKYIVMDDRSTDYRPTISFKTTGDGTWYLAANNIELSTVRAFDRIVDPGQVPSGEHPYYFNEVVDVRGRFDGLHFAGGAWAVAHGRDYNNYDPFCVPSSPSADVETPSGMRHVLEMGDNTKVMLSPLSYNLNTWGESVLHVGNNCTLMIFTDVSNAAMYADPGVMQAFQYIYNYDGYHSTAGRVTGKSGMTTIYGGNNFSLYIGYGSPENGVASFPLTVRTPVRHDTINFGALTGCSHIVEGASMATIQPLIDTATGLAVDKGSTTLVYISNHAEFVGASGGSYINGSDTVYTFNDTSKTYLVTGNILLSSTEVMSVGNGVRFVGTGPTSSSIHGQRSNGWLLVQPGGANKFENLNIDIDGLGIFYEDTVDYDIIFNKCRLPQPGVYGNLYIPIGAGTVQYLDCTMPLNAYMINPPLTINSKVRFERCVFDQTDSSYGSNIGAVFSLAGCTINGQLIFKDCQVNTTVYTTYDVKQTLLSVKSTSTGAIPIITNPAGIVIDNCTHNWVNGNTYNGGKLILGDFRSIPNFVFLDDDRMPLIERGKRVVPIYDSVDWPKPHLANQYVNLKPNTIYRVYGNIITSFVSHFLAQGTEVEGASGMDIDSIQFGTSTSVTGIVPFIACGDNWAIRNIKIDSYATGLERIIIESSPNPFAGSGQPAAWHDNKPVVIDNVEFVWQNSATFTRWPIKFKGANGVTSPSFEIGNLVVHDAAHNCMVDNGNPDAVKNLTIRNITRGPLGGTKRRPQITFLNAAWTGRVTVRDSELVEPPITITGGAGVLVAANRVTAFHNRGVDAAGTYGQSLSSYVDGILMSDATLMLAQGNILGAPNSP